jgi:ribosomal protein S18 acetylase RimI-like enzyme
LAAGLLITERSKYILLERELDQGSTVRESVASILSPLARLVFHIRFDGLKNTLKELIFFRRTMVIVEKDIDRVRNADTDSNVEFIIVNKSNHKVTRKKYNLPAIQYYAAKHSNCLVAFKDGGCPGHIWWTQRNDSQKMRPLRKLGLRLGPDEAYMFGLFVLPRYRGTAVPKMIALKMLNYLFSRGVRRFYGFYFTDNKRALWFIRSVLCAKEIKRVTVYRLPILKYLN